MQLRVTRDDEQLPPHSPEAEERCLGSIFHEPEIIAEVAKIVKPEHFFRQEFEEVYRAILVVHGQAKPINGIVVAEQMVQAGWDQREADILCAECAERTPDPCNWREYAAIVRSKGQLRQIALTLDRFRPKMDDPANSPDDVGASLRAQLDEILARTGLEAGDGPKSPEFTGSIRPLTADLLAVPRLPLELIPDPLRPWLQDIAHRGCFAIETPVAATIVALSSLLGRNLAIRPKRHDDWQIIPNLWGGIVGHPGIQKSPPVLEALKPLRRLAADAVQAYEEAMKRLAEDAELWELKAAAAKKKAADLVKKGASDDEVRSLIAESNQAMDRPKPVCKRYEANDATVEKFADLLRDNPRGLLQFRDELTGFFRTMEKQGHEDDKAFYLEGWAGNGQRWVDRMGRGTSLVKHLCVSIFGTIQPGPLAKYLKGSVTGEEADGFMPRFQILLYPDPPEEFVNVDQWPHRDAKNTAYEIFRWIDALQPGDLGAEYDEDSDLHYLRFCNEAQILFDSWRTELETRLRSGAESSLMLAHLAKYRSLMPSLALIFHVINSYGEGRLNPVSLDAAQAAAAWCDLLEAHARRVYQVATDGDPLTAARLGERIKKSLPNPFTFRQVANKGWAGLDDVESVRRAVGILEDRGWAKVVVKPPGPNGGRPSEEVWINPAIHGSTNDVS